MRQKVEIIIAMAVIFLAGAFVGPEATAGETTRTTLQVQNLSCGACLAKIETELSTLEGMVGMDADLSQGLVIVDHQAPLVAPTIAYVISDLGYPARVVSGNAVSGDRSGRVDQKQKSAVGAGCGGCGPGGCGANVSTWKKLYQRYWGSRNKPR